MKRNIYQKLHDACLSAKSVKKGAKAKKGGAKNIYKTIDEDRSRSLSNLIVPTGNNSSMM